jgi:ketosteroid isomerase-like protein
VSIASEVQAVAAAFDEALVGNDASLIADFMTDDWVYVGPEGPVAKADLIGWIASGRLAHHTMKAVSPERVVEMGDALLVTSRRVSTGLWEGEAYTADEWISDIWVRSEGSWRCAFSQKSPV